MLPAENNRRAISTSPVNTVCAQADIEFTFVHVCMGQGDCTLIKCPDGAVIIVDAGSSRANTLLGDIPFYEACALLRSDKWCGAQGNKVNALIVTHSDMDHINKIYDLLRAQSLDYTPSITDSKTGELKHKAEKWNVDNITVETCYKPLIEKSTTKSEQLDIIKGKQRDSYANKLPAGNIDKFVDITTPPIPTDPMIVAQGNGWRVEIITGAVPLENKDKSNDLNACSIMTLCRIWRKRPGANEINEKRALFCGDATYSTESYACANWRDHISNLNLLMVPHHGSENGSSEPFIQLTNPKRIIVSVNDIDRKYQHPRYDGVLQKYRECVRERSEEHEFGYWYIENEKEKEIEVDGTSYRIELKDFYDWLYGVNKPTGDPWDKLEIELRRDKLEFGTVGTKKNACVVLGDDNEKIAEIFDIEAISQSQNSKTNEITHLIWYVEGTQLNQHTTGTGSKLFKMNTKRLQEFEMPILKLENGEIKIATEGALKSLPPKNPSLNTFTNTPIVTPTNTSPGTSGQKRPRDRHDPNTPNKKTKTTLKSSANNKS